MRKILVGTDLSPSSEIAVAHAMDRARRSGAEVVLAMIHVIPEAPIGLTPRTDAALASYRIAIGQTLADARRQLGELRERWLGQGVEVSQIVADGVPDTRLPELATEIGADMIVVGSHGRTGLTWLLMGSVAERVVRFAPCDALVSRGTAPIDGYRRIVVGTDFSALADVALERAVMAAAPGGTIDIVHCWEIPTFYVPMEAPAGVPMSVADLAELQANFIADGEGLVAKSRDRTSATLRFHVARGAAVRTLSDFASASKADLIVLGSHGRRGIRRLLLGSVAEVTVRHAGCSVLIAR